jgi:hypothetical protein
VGHPALLQLTMKIIYLLLLFLSMCVSAHAQKECKLVAQSTDSTLSRIDYSSLIQPALSILRNAKKFEFADICIKQAMFVLGREKPKEAIPLLVDWLTWENKSRFPYRIDSPGYKYPAVSALFEIGEPAVPALIKVISEHAPQEQLAKNARYAFMSIHREFPGDGIRQLRAHAHVAQGNTRKNLSEAANAASKAWCKHANCAKTKTDSPVLER